MHDACFTQKSRLGLTWPFFRVSAPTEARAGWDADSSHEAGQLDCHTRRRAHEPSFDLQKAPSDALEAKRFGMENEAKRRTPSKCRAVTLTRTAFRGVLAAGARSAELETDDHRFFHRN